MTTGLKKTVAAGQPRSHLPAGWARTPTGLLAESSPFGCTSSCPRGQPFPTHILDPLGPTPSKKNPAAASLSERYARHGAGRHPAPQLYDWPSTARSTSSWDPAGPTHRVVSRPTSLFELPFMVTKRRGDLARLLGHVRQAHARRFRPRRTFSAPWVHGPGIIHTREPVAEMADLQGMTIRAPTRIINALLGELGATPGRPADPARLPENLSRGVIDGAVDAVGSHPPRCACPELVGNHTEVSAATMPSTRRPSFSRMNKGDAYEALPEDLRQIIDANSRPGVFGLRRSHPAGI